MMDFGFLPPEIISSRIYGGPGSGSLLAAAAAWDGLAMELRTAAGAYSSAISGLTVDWQGPSSAAMVAAIEPYIAWLRNTASRAEFTGSQAKSAAAAYQTVFASVVPPPAIAANRTVLSELVATNIVGQNAAAIAATEAAYGQMWVQDAAAMSVYTESSSTAAQLSPFEQPPAMTRQPGTSAPDSSALARGLTDAASRSALPESMSPPEALSNVAAAPAADPAGLDMQAIQNLVGLVSQVQAAAVVSVISGLGIAAQNLGATLDAAGASAAAPAPAAALQSGALARASAAGPAVAAQAGEARTVGSLSVPSSWAAATPTVRLAAVAVSGAAAAPAAGPEILDAAMGQLALASMVGNALGGTGAARVKSHAAQKDRPLADDDKETPEKLRRVLSQLAQEPESVQHWHTDKAHLDNLLEQLSNRPGIHTVHVSKKSTFKTRLTGPF